MSSTLKVPIPDEVLVAALLSVHETGHIVTDLAALHQYRTPTDVTVLDHSRLAVHARLLYVQSRVRHRHTALAAALHPDRRLVLVRPVIRTVLLRCLQIRLAAGDLHTVPLFAFAERPDVFVVMLLMN